uniref:Uncharacterized protein n=1 Tax=Plectus sambesii TaxID=2011161 RepID=A0A914VW33_9BILA
MNFSFLLTIVIFGTVRASPSRCGNPWRVYEGKDCTEKRCSLSESQGANPACQINPLQFKQVCCWDSPTAVKEGERPSCPTSTIAMSNTNLLKCSPKASSCPPSTTCRRAYNSTTESLCCSSFSISHIWREILDMNKVSPFAPNEFIPWLDFAESRVYNGDSIPLAYKDVIGHDDTFCSSFYGSPFNATNADSFYYHQLLFDAHQNSIASAYMFAVDINGTKLIEATEPDSQCHTTNTDPSVYINNALRSKPSSKKINNKQTIHKAVYMLFRTKEPIGTLEAVNITDPSLTLSNFFTNIFPIMGKPVGAHIFNFALDASKENVTESGRPKY